MYSEQEIIAVRHWDDALFSIRTTRPATFRFESGHFVMIGLHVDGKALTRAYSIASAVHDSHLEFLSIKVPDGPLTSRLQHVRPGDRLLVGRKPVGTLVLSDLRPGKRLYLFSTGTGLAPFMSIIQDPATYERHEQVVLVHGARRVSELAYADFIAKQLPDHEFLGELLRDKLMYYPTVTREPFRNRGRITDLVADGRLFRDMNLPPLDPVHDRAMLCGSPSLLVDLSRLLGERGLRVSPHRGSPGDYVFERAFAEKC